MTAKRHYSILTIFLIIVLCINLLNVQPVRADGETPTEPPAPTEIATEQPTEPPVEATPVPIESTPVPEEATATPLAEILTQVPESTEVVILDENGNAIPLATQEAAEITQIIDPIWCPVGVLPGGVGSGCSTAYGTISALVSNMASNPTFYDEAGIIYFTSSAGGSLTLTNAAQPTSLGTSSFNTLRNFNLTLQGGWNGSTVSPTISGQTSFGGSTITIGAPGSGNPWVGNITLNDFTFNGSSNQSPINIYTTTGNITLSNVDVTNQQNDENTAILSSTSGNIVVQNGSTFDGDTGDESRGVSATTTSGSITISDTTFSDSRQGGNGATTNNTNDGATLSAPIVTLTNVTANNSDGNGITINNANVITLSNVTASNNGTESGASGLSGNLGSGVFVNGNAGSRLIIIGGTFTNNQEYGVEVGNPANTTIYVQSVPTCTGNDSNAAPTSSCYNDTVIIDSTGPVITPNVSGTGGANGWYTSNVSVSWTVADAESGVLSSTGCTTSSLTSETTGATFTCSATNNAGLANSASVTVKIDKTGPTAVALSITGGILGSNAWYTSDVTVQTSGTDSMSGVSCTPDQIQSAETTGAVINGSCTNGAGLTTNASPLTIKLDKTAPITTLSVTAGTAGNNGWYRSDVTLHTSGDETIGSPVTCTADQSQTAETAGTTFNGSCTNNAGLSASASSLDVKLDKTNPTITFAGRTASNGNGWNNTDVTVDWSCTDALSGQVSNSVSQTVTAEGAGQTATGTCTDQAGNTASDTQGGINIDKTAPLLTVPSNITAEATSASGAVVSYSASVTDNLDASVTVSCSPISSSTFGLGSTTVNCSSTDKADNTANGSFQVTVQDTTAPIITAHPDVTFEATSAAGAAANYTSPSTSDIVDGAGAAICSPASGTTFALGDTTVTCNVSDSSGNAAIATTFVVHVVDTTAPVIASHPDVTVQATSASGAVVSYASPSTFDAVDGTGTATCSPASGTAFALGNTTVTCNATDSHGNVASPTTFVVHVVDTAAPIIASHPDVTVEATSAAGATANYSSPSTADDVDGAGTANCSPASGTFFAFGDTTITCNATDSNGNAAAPTSFVVHVVDTTGPVIASHLDVTVEATSATGTVAIYNSPATSDAVDGAGIATCSPASGIAFPFGNTTVTCNATDSLGNAATPTTFVVHVVDTTAPIIAAHLDVTVEATSASGAVATYTNPSTSDVVDGAGSASCSPASGTTFGLGDTTVTCDATDANGNAALPVTFTVHVIDTTAPVIATHLDVTVEATSPSGAVANYTSPSTSDAVDGAGTANCSPASGTTFTVGNTTVTCNAMDTHGNLATATSFTVHVVDTTAPTLSLPANITANATGPSGAVVTYPVSATDIVDGSVPVSCVPASGSTFPLGPTTVNCSATDSHSNSSNGSFTVNVQDPDGPTITLPGNMMVEATGPTGASVSYSASATDVVDGSVPVSCAPSSGTSFGFGTTAVNCSASDSSSNTNNAAFLVTVEDTTAPAIAPHSDFTTTTFSLSSMVVNYNSPSTSDAVDGAGTASCSPVSGSLFSIGNTQVNCAATDSHGNSATSTFFIHVTLLSQASTTSAPPQSLSTSSAFIIPLTGGELIQLDCNSVLWMFGIKLSFLNLCDHQATIHSVGANNLPAELPDGFSFVMGLDVDILSDDQIIKNLPDGSGIEMDFPIYNQSPEQYKVLYWSDADGDGKGEWIEISQQIGADQISQIINTNTDDELYQLIQNSLDVFYPILTTDKTGVFVLVKK